jgi:PTH1 family peptidyl-tRNA hydrolase
MFLIVGLGNPGSEYERTRHNLGFMVIDKLAAQEGIAVTRRECRSLVARGDIEGQAVKLVKPQTYMNLSGEAVGCLLRKHAVTNADNRRLIVISDDLALPVGKIRIRERGSAGGHNGLKSIIAALGDNEFIRLRIGIQPEHQLEDTRGFVLNNFPRGERAIVEEVLEKSADAVRIILREGALKAMAKFN